MLRGRWDGCQAARCTLERSARRSRAERQHVPLSLDRLDYTGRLSRVDRVTWQTRWRNRAVGSRARARSAPACTGQSSSATRDRRDRSARARRAQTGIPRGARSNHDGPRIPGRGKSRSCIGGATTSSVRDGHAAVNQNQNHVGDHVPRLSCGLQRVPWIRLSFRSLPARAAMPRRRFRTCELPAA
jgi:hypothetical protein